MREANGVPGSSLRWNGMVLKSGPITFSAPSKSMARPDATMPIVIFDEIRDWRTESHTA